MWAATYLLQNIPDKITFYTDCVSALQVASGASVPNEHKYLASSTASLVKILSSKALVTWEHVPGHAGVPGNEIADTLTNVAYTLPTVGDHVSHPMSEIRKIEPRAVEWAADAFFAECPLAQTEKRLWDRLSPFCTKEVAVSLARPDFFQHQSCVIALANVVVAGWLGIDQGYTAVAGVARCVQVIIRANLVPLILPEDALLAARTIGLHSACRSSVLIKDGANKDYIYLVRIRNFGPKARKLFVSPIDNAIEQISPNTTSTYL